MKLFALMVSLTQILILETPQAMNAAPATNESTSTREIAQYRKMPILPMNVDILGFWRDHQKSLPM
jgi:hypothetical protein